jgi:hypothetical protein
MQGADDDTESKFSSVNLESAALLVQIPHWQASVLKTPPSQATNAANLTLQDPTEPDCTSNYPAGRAKAMPGQQHIIPIFLTATLESMSVLYAFHSAFNTFLSSPFLGSSAPAPFRFCAFVPSPRGTLRKLSSRFSKSSRSA